MAASKFATGIDTYRVGLLVRIGDVERQRLDVAMIPTDNGIVLQRNYNRDNNELV